MPTDSLSDNCAQCQELLPHAESCRARISPAAKRPRQPSPTPSSGAHPQSGSPPTKRPAAGENVVVTGGARGDDAVVSCGARGQDAVHPENITPAASAFTSLERGDLLRPHQGSCAALLEMAFGPPHLPRPSPPGSDADSDALLSLVSLAHGPTGPTKESAAPSTEHTQPTARALALLDVCRAEDNMCEGLLVPPASWGQLKFGESPASGAH